MQNTLLRRAGGIGLLLLSLGPPVVVVAGLGIATKLAIDVVAVTRDKVDAVVDTANTQIAPRIAAIRAGYEALSGDAERLDAQLGQTFRTLGSLQDIRIEAGQFGSSSLPHVRIPDNDVWVGPVKIGGGQVVDRDLPAISLPSQPVSIPVTPLRAAFAPFGQDGPVGQAIGAAEGELGHTVASVKALGDPIQQMIGTVQGWIAPLSGAVDRIVLIGGLVVAAVLALLAAYLIAGVALAIRRRAEAAAAYRAGGEIGYVLWVHRTMVLDGFARVRGRNPAALRGPTVRELQQAIEALRADLEQMRTPAEATPNRPALAA